MDVRRVEELKESLKSKDTPELLGIWKSNNREVYVEEAFEAVRLLLEERNVPVPAQSADAAENSHLEKAYRYYLHEKDFEKSLKECNLAVSLEPSNADAHNLRGIVLVELGRPAEAMKAYKKAIELEPGFREAEENLAYLESELKALNNLATIATFNFPSDAHVARMALESEGIWSFLADEETLYTATHISIAAGGVKLKVKAEDVQRALEIMNRMDKKETE